MEAIKELLLHVKDDDLVVFTVLIHDNKKTWVENKFNGSMKAAEVAYINNVKSIVTWLRTNSPKGHFVWTTSNSYIESRCPKKFRKYQRNRRILRISSIARKYWMEQGFPVLDTFDLTGIVCRSKKCSLDGGHFNSAVNWVKSQLLLNHFCKPKSCETIFI